VEQLDAGAGPSASRRPCSLRSTWSRFTRSNASTQVRLELGWIAGGHPQRSDDPGLPPGRAPTVRNGHGRREARDIDLIEGPDDRNDPKDPVQSLVPPVGADRIGALEVGQHEFVEQSGAWVPERTSTRPRNW
jgi:hypothetical protein